MDKSLELAKQQTKLEDITEESLNNLASRLLTKKGAMGKKASKKGAGKEATAMVDDLAKARTKVLAVVDLTKAIAMFEKKRSRKTAQTIADKMHAIKACGVFQFLPACASCFALHSVLFIATLDQRFLESVETVKTSTIMEHCADAGPAEQESIQSALVVRLVTEKVRLSVENKETATVAKDSATRLCNALIPHIGGSIKKLLEAVVCVLQDRRHSTTDVVASLVIIDGNKHNELVKVLTNLEPLDSVISAARKYAAESQRLGEFISELRNWTPSARARKPLSSTLVSRQVIKPRRRMWRSTSWRHMSKRSNPCQPPIQETWRPSCRSSPTSPRCSNLSSTLS